MRCAQITTLSLPEPHAELCSNCQCRRKRKMMVVGAGWPVAVRGFHTLPSGFCLGAASALALLPSLPWNLHVVPHICPDRQAGRKVPESHPPLGAQRS